MTHDVDEARVRDMLRHAFGGVRQLRPPRVVCRGLHAELAGFGRGKLAPVPRHTFGVDRIIREEAQLFIFAARDRHTVDVFGWTLEYLWMPDQSVEDASGRRLGGADDHGVREFAGSV